VIDGTDAKHEVGEYAMDGKHRQRSRRRSSRLESLEARNLLSLFISAKPTIEVVPQGGRVHPNHAGGFTILQPTEIKVRGVAQPPAPNLSVVVQIYGVAADGSVLNGGSPLATATPNFLGQYSTSVTLPSKIRKDVNQLVAYEIVTGTLTSEVRIDPTTLTGLNGSLAIQGTEISGISGQISLNGGSISGITGSISNPTITGTLTGTSTTNSAAISGISGELIINGFPIFLDGELGDAGPADGSFSGTGTLAGQTGTIQGSLAIPGSTSSLSNGAAIQGPQVGAISAGSGSSSATTGSFSQSGTATIAGTNGTSTTIRTEYSTSDPVTIYVHQTRGNAERIRAQRVDGKHPVMPNSPSMSRAISLRRASRGRHTPSKSQH
jgi:hypothetical protein